MKQIIPEQKVMIEVEISGHIQTREEFDSVVYGGFLENKFTHRAIIHIGDKMNWQWCRSEQEAEDWVNYRVRKYTTL